MHRAGSDQQHLVGMKEKALAAGEILADPAAHENEFIVGMRMCDRGAGLHVDVVADRDKIAAQLIVCRVLRQMLVNDGFNTMVCHRKCLAFCRVTFCDNFITKKGLQLSVYLVL